MPCPLCVLRGARATRCIVPPGHRKVRRRGRDAPGLCPRRALTRRFARLQERVWTRVLAVVAAVLSQARNDEQVLGTLRENLARARREHSEYVRTVGPRTEELEKEGQALRRDLATAQARLQSAEREAMALANENERLRAIVAEGLEESHMDRERSGHVLDEAAPAAMAEALRLAGQENVRQVNLLSSLNQVSPPLRGAIPHARSIGSHGSPR